MKRYFKRPKLLGIGEELPNRAATPLELFFDLAFVVAMAHLVITLQNNNSTASIFYIIIKFVALFIYWIAITKYNQYFEDNTPIHRIIILLSMVPILLITTGGPKIGRSSLILFTIAFIISRLFIIFIWLWSSFKVENEYLNKVVSVNYTSAILSIIASILSLEFIVLKNYYLWSIVWVVILLVEVLYPIYRFRRINRLIDFDDPNVPVFDRKLQIERSTLFMILILGEGLVGTAELLNRSLENSQDLIYAISLLLTTFSLIWIFMDYYSSHTIKVRYFLSLNYLNLFQTLGTFLIIAGFVTIFHGYSYNIQVTIGLGMFLYGLCNILIYNYMDKFIYERYHHHTENEVKYIERLDFRKTRESFVLNIAVAIIIMTFKMSIPMLVIVVNMTLIVNIIFIIREAVFLKEE